MKMKQIVQCAAAVSIALVLSPSYATDSSGNLTGKEKATAIGAGTGAVAGAVVGGPVGAVVGAGVGGVIGHEGTDANGKVPASSSSHSASVSSSKVRRAQSALSQQGYDVGTVDGRAGPSTQAALRRFQQDKGLAQTGTLDRATQEALGV